jgi:hypothetical protein
MRAPELKEGPNLYAYVRNDPMNATDRLGLSRISSQTETAEPLTPEDTQQLINDLIDSMINTMPPDGSGCCKREKKLLDQARVGCLEAQALAFKNCARAMKHTPEIAGQECAAQMQKAEEACAAWAKLLIDAAQDYLDCLKNNGCEPSDSCSGPPPGPRPSPPCGIGCLGTR